MPPAQVPSPHRRAPDASGMTTARPRAAAHALTTRRSPLRYSRPDFRMNTNPSALTPASPTQVHAPSSRRRCATTGRHAARHWFSFVGAGALIAVGYIDPGNWATALGAGAGYGYRLLGVVLLASLMAMLLQWLSSRLGVVTGRDLAQVCRERYRPARHPVPVADQRSRDHRVRCRRGGRQRRRVAIAARRVADGGRADVGGLHVRAARAPAERRPLQKRDRGADRLRRPVLRGRARAGAPGLARRARRHARRASNCCAMPAWCGSRRASSARR